MDAMLQGMTSRDIAEWRAFYLITDSAEQPDPTKWDSPDTVQAKLTARAQRNAK